eukprot:8838602-Alexandrium_andersonii.AAC.1
MRRAETLVADRTNTSASDVRLRTLPSDLLESHALAARGTCRNTARACDRPGRKGSAVQRDKNAAGGN